MNALKNVRYEKVLSSKVYSRRALGHYFLSDICVIVAAISDCLKFVSEVAWLSVFLVTLEYFAFAVFFVNEEFSRRVSIIDLFKEYSSRTKSNMPTFFFNALPLLIIFWSMFLSWHQFPLVVSIVTSAIEYALITAYLLFQCLVVKIGAPMIDDLLLVQKEWRR